MAVHPKVVEMFHCGPRWWSHAKTKKNFQSNARLEIHKYLLMPYVISLSGMTEVKNLVLTLMPKHNI